VERYRSGAFKVYVVWVPMLGAEEPNVFMLGYYKEKEVTEQALRGGWFHTGDRGYLDEDGYLYFLDRLKDVIRRRGENISPVEIERAVLAHPHVAEAAAVGVPSDLVGGEEEIAVFVLARPGIDLLAESAFCQDAGNVALNNCLNAKAVHGAVSNLSGTMRVPRINYEVLSNFGGIAMRDGLLVHGPGQELSYDRHEMDIVNCFALDDSQMSRLDILKIDVEGMEMDVLKGASATIGKLKPVVISEWLHCGVEAITSFLKDFEHFKLGGNIVSVPMSEKYLITYVSSRLDHA